MKRSRTCQCLVDLDDTPKRTRSTPDLGALRRLGALQQRQTSRDVFGGRQNFDLDSALQLLHQAVAIPGKRVHRWTMCLVGRSGGRARGEGRGWGGSSFQARTHGELSRWSVFLGGGSLFPRRHRICRSRPEFIIPREVRHHQQGFAAARRKGSAELPTPVVEKLQKHVPCLLTLLRD